ncbi:MAG TPA: DAHL domain-containing protein [Gammaproteobacteria bacterium]
MWRNKYFSSLLVIAAFSILIFLYVKTSSVNVELYTNTITALRDLLRIDADWSAEALKTRAALNQDFDPLAEVLPQIRSVKTKLSKSELADSNDGFSEINQLLEDLFEKIKEKDQNIELFKSGHAILRNSIRFLPTAEKELINQAEAAKNIALQVSVKNISGRIYAYILLPDTNVKDDLQTQVNALFASDKSNNSELTNALIRFTNHAKVILERVDVTKELLDKAIATPTVNAIEKLAASYNAFHNKRLATIESFRIALMSYSTFLVLVLIVFGLKLKTSYRALNVANTALVTANENLEQKVEERTRKLKESQIQLVQSEKMAAVGQMVAGVAHEINTPLGYVHSNIEIIHDLMGNVEEVIGDFVKFCELMRSPSANEESINSQVLVVNDHVSNLSKNDLLKESKHLLTDAKYGLEQISDIVVNLKDFSRMDRSREHEFNVNDGIESTLKIAYNSYKHVATIKKDFGDVPNTLCSPSQINQVFLNIITNAVHAIRDVDKQGVITIKTGASKNSVFVSIKDNGTGMSEEVQKHLFEPFFTTKDVGQGTGLGLSISHSIIKEHKGAIKLLSKEGVGSNFLIILPIRVSNVIDITAPQSFEKIA